MAIGQCCGEPDTCQRNCALARSNTETCQNCQWWKRSEGVTLFRRERYMRIYGECGIPMPPAATPYPRQESRADYWCVLWRKA